MKKYILTFLVSIFLALPLAAKENNVNIYADVRQAPQTAFYSSSGKKVTLADFKGKFVLLVSWSRDCLPCIREMKSLNSFYNQTKDNGLEVILLSKEKEWSDLEEQRRFLEKYSAPDLNFYVDRDGKLTEDLAIFTSPHTVLVNSLGNEVGRIRGSAEWDKPEVIEYIYQLKSANDNR